MPFPSIEHGDDRIFNNADSFAMAFDAAWKNFNPGKDEEIPTESEKLAIILSKIDQHPFLKEFPIKAKEVAQFRIRLLNLR